MRFLLEEESIEYCVPTDPNYTVAMIENFSRFQIIDARPSESCFSGDISSENDMPIISSLHLVS